jgi:RecA/RadA recombinase
MPLMPPTKKKHKVLVEDTAGAVVAVTTGEMESNIVDVDAASIEAKIQRLLGFSTFEPEQRYWLDTGSPDLNAVLGSRELGIPYGKIIELRGEEHGGKTTLSTLLAGMAQRDGAAVGYIDLEDSRDEQWATKLGLDLTKVTKVYPKLIQPSKKAETEEGEEKEKEDRGASRKKKRKKLKGQKGMPYLQAAEELFAEAETGMALLAQAGIKKQFWFLDSIANLQPAEVVDAGAMKQNMHTGAARAAYLSIALPRWAGLAANYNAMIILINQMRTRPGVMFGSPDYSPGGKALRHNCSIRANVKRLKNGQLRKGERIIGLVGVVENFKNKAGGGSVQSAKAGFKVLWNRTPAKYEFMSKSEAEAQLG